MKLILIISILISLTSHSDNRLVFYDAFTNDSQEKTKNALTMFENIKNPTSIISVYKGALYMKKAMYIFVPTEKLQLFVSGKDLIEEEIKKDSKNVEMRFIRLVLQEQTPSFLKYKSNIDEDKIMILKSYVGLDAYMKNIIGEYAKISTALSPGDIE